MSTSLAEFVRTTCDSHLDSLCPRRVRATILKLLRKHYPGRGCFPPAVCYPSALEQPIFLRERLAELRRESPERSYIKDNFALSIIEVNDRNRNACLIYAVVAPRGRGKRREWDRWRIMHCRNDCGYFPEVSYEEAVKIRGREGIFRSVLGYGVE